MPRLVGRRHMAWKIRGSIKGALPPFDGVLGQLLRDEMMYDRQTTSGARACPVVFGPA